MSRYSIIALAVLACFVVAARKSPHSDISATDAAAVRAQIDRYVRTALAAALRSPPTLTRGAMR